MTMIPRERIPFTPIVDRPAMKVPNNGRIIIWSIVNLEVWDIARPMARQMVPAPTGQVLLPDVANWSWHEYGMRVGVWRFFDLYKKLGIKPTLSINARVCEDYPRVAQEALDQGWEFMAHAYEQGPIHKIEDQSAMIHKTMDVIEAFTHKRPVGWLGPGLTQTPYTLELNDIPTMIVQHHESGYWQQRCTDAFDRLYAEGAERPRVMAISIHPYISGQPHRIKYLEEVYAYINRFEGVVHMNGEEIYDWYASGQAGV